VCAIPAKDFDGGRNAALQFLLLKKRKKFEKRGQLGHLGKKLIT
jgi:hypothetical protein